MNPPMFRWVVLLPTFWLAFTAGASADVPFLEGPYVDRVGHGSATLHVRTDADTSVRARFEGGGHVETRESQPGRMHSILVSGLPDDTEIHYRVEAAGHRTKTGRFRTPPTDRGKPVSFLVVGDCRDGDADHAQVIRTMRGDHAFLLHLGDMVPTGGDPSQWTTFLRIAAPILERMPIVPVLGNHEIIAPSGPQLYRERFALPDGGQKAYYVFDHGGVRILVLDSNAPLEAGTPQHDFALRELERASSDAGLSALVVALHHGPFSSGRHGELEVMHTSGLLDAMRRARVDLVFSGHDHIYERGQADGLKYIVSGGCGSPLYPSNAREPYQLAFVPAYHHVRVTVSSGRFEVDVLGADARRIERCTFERGRDFVCGQRSRRGPQAGIAPVEDQAMRLGPVLGSAVAVLAIGYLGWRRLRRGNASGDRR